MSLSWRRVGALILRNFYVLRSSWPRVLELAYWPMMQMVLWGFITMFFLQHSSWVAQAAGVRPAQWRRGGLGTAGHDGRGHGEQAILPS